jgi:predicted HTH transcriptional regulator
MNIPNLLISSAIGAIVGSSVGYAIARFQNRRKPTQNELNKKENIKKLEEYILKNNKISNDDVENLLGISNTSSWRYLDELEKQGKIRQVGNTGKHTYYEKI